MILRWPDLFLFLRLRKKRRMSVSTNAKPATPPTIPPTSTGVGGALSFPEPFRELEVGAAAVPVLEPPMPPAPAPVFDAALAADAEEDWLASDDDADALRVVGVAVIPELRDWPLREDVVKPLRVEAAAAIEEILAIDVCDAVDCAKRNAMALDCELRLLRLDDAAALEPIEVAVGLISWSPRQSA